jgi:hypothetical protein
MNPELRLRFLKLLVNVPLRVADRLLPDVAEGEVEFPQTRMLLRAYAKLLKAYRLERVQGVFGPKPDANFERLLRVSRKVLAGISEEDRYYRAWLGLAFILAQEEMSEFNEPVAEIKRLIKAQWLTDLSFLQEKAIIYNRREFLETALCDYLVNLARMECEVTPSS